MAGLVEAFARPIGWTLAPCNVIVEGTSDVRLIVLTDRLYQQRNNLALLAGQLSILAAGKKDDGGVEGVNRRLNAARQLADVDRTRDGRVRFRFVGLYDNDFAGQRATENARKFDRRLQLCRDIFLLNPKMPLASGADHLTLQNRFQTENSAFAGLDWELEDLLSPRILAGFDHIRPNAVQRIRTLAGRTHRDFSREGKRELHDYVQAHASLDDVVEVVNLIRSLRDYFDLPISHIVE